MSDKRYRRTGQLVFACIGFVLAVSLLGLLLAGVVITGGDTGWGVWLTGSFLVMWALDKADDVKIELDKPPRPRDMPLDEP